MKKLLSLLLISVFLLTSNLVAQARNKQVIDVELAKDAPKVDKYAIMVDEVDKMFAELKKTRAQIQAGNVSKVNIKDFAGKEGRISNNVFSYLNALYLYCARNNGTCPEILDTIFEIDLINSVVESKASCINTLRYWKSWQANDMEKRLGFSTKIMHMNKVTKFNRELRPKYLKCRATIDEKLNGRDELTFLQNLSKSTNKEDYLEKALLIQEDSKNKSNNIFVTLGMAK